jgi:hypothetical protein
MSVSIEACDEQTVLWKPGAKDVSEKPVVGVSVPDLSILQNAELLDRLAKLLECIRIDPHSGDLILERGEARLTLKENGVLRIQARSIVQVAEEDITLYGAYIDLN